MSSKMCGRYALALRPREVRQHLQDANMPSQEDIPDDADVRNTYNFAPNSYGLVYRAAGVPDHGAGAAPQDYQQDDSSNDKTDNTTSDEPRATSALTSQHTPEHHDAPVEYKLQSMKWGLIPFWTKRPPDYGSTMRTINCRDDSLATPGGMWTTMKQKKRCIVVAQGFYEWLKKPGGVKVPHYVKRKDGQLMCFAGLWDCARYEDADKPLYSYTIITTSSSSRLSFLHDRMPVILDPASDAMTSWLSPTQDSWTRELQSILKPYEGGLDCYPVPKEVGKVGNNSPTFVVPIDSRDNPNNIANFFGGAGDAGRTGKDDREKSKVGAEAKKPGTVADDHIEKQEIRGTTDKSLESEDNAPKPEPLPCSGTDVKRKRDQTEQISNDSENTEKPAKAIKTEQTSSAPPASKSSTRPTRSATKNPSPIKSKSPLKAQDGSKKITSFFGT